MCTVERVLRAVLGGVLAGQREPLSSTHLIEGSCQKSAHCNLRRKKKIAYHHGCGPCQQFIGAVHVSRQEKQSKMTYDRAIVGEIRIIFLAQAHLCLKCVNGVGRDGERGVILVVNLFGSGNVRISAPNAPDEPGALQKFFLEVMTRPNMEPGVLVVSTGSLSNTLEKSRTPQSVPASSPLQDCTNLTPSASADLERMEKMELMEKEIAHLKGLVDVFSSRRGRGRTKRAWCVLSCYAITSRHRLTLH